METSSSIGYLGVAEIQTGRAIIMMAREAKGVMDRSTALQPALSVTGAWFSSHKHGCRWG